MVRTIKLIIARVRNLVLAAWAMLNWLDTSTYEEYTHSPPETISPLLQRRIQTIRARQATASHLQHSSSSPERHLTPERHPRLKGIHDAWSKVEKIWHERSIIKIISLFTVTLLGCYFTQQPTGTSYIVTINFMLRLSHFSV